MEKYLVVLLGGAIGSLARYLAASAIASRFPGKFPLGTVIVNVTGCFLIGVIMTSLARQTALHSNLRLFLVVGILGGYTTFSSFAWETFALTRAGNPVIGLINVAASVILGYLAVWLGAATVRR